MQTIKFKKELYSRTALIKAAYNFVDRAYLHLDSDDKYYYVTIKGKEESPTVLEEEFLNEMLVQSVRHEVFMQTKNIRELLLARAMATSLVVRESPKEIWENEFEEDNILRDWYKEDD